MYDTSYIMNSKVIESLQTIKGKLNNSRVLLGCKEITHICHRIHYNYRNIDEHNDDVSFLGNYMYYFIPTFLYIYSNYNPVLTV